MSRASHLRLTARLPSVDGLLASAAFSLALALFVGNFWVSDDAYIVFRSVEQLFAGNGPTFNVHERVQVYTSPAWYWLLSLCRLYFTDLYLAVLLLSGLLWAVTLWVVHRLVDDGAVFFVAVCLFAASIGFHDYTASGLENPLGYLVVALFAFCYRRWLHGDGGVLPICLLLGLAGLVRHDLLTLLTLPLGYALWRHWTLLSRVRRLECFLLALGPLLAWTAFAVVYYGFPLPNTAYAKTNLSLDPFDVVAVHGLSYWRALLDHDAATLVVILAALAVGVWSWRRCGAVTALAAGVLLNCLYVTAVGGDFMLGRFSSFAYLLSCFVLWLGLRSVPLHGCLWGCERRAVFLLGVLAAVVLLSFFARTPLSAWWHDEPVGDLSAVMDERSYYFATTLPRYLERDRWELFPLTPEAEQGFSFARGPNRTLVVAALGQAGYHARLDQVVLDYFGLASPLLARIDGVAESRVGHVCRTFPDGFVGVWEEGEAAIVDAAVLDYHRRLQLVTSSPDLWSSSRWREIVLLNVVDRKLPAGYLPDARLPGCDRLVTTG